MLKKTKFDLWYYYVVNINNELVLTLKRRNVFWLSESWTFNRFEINYLERRKTRAKGKVAILKRHLVEGVSPNISPRPFCSEVWTDEWGA